MLSNSLECIIFPTIVFLFILEGTLRLEPRLLELATTEIPNAKFISHSLFEIHVEDHSDAGHLNSSGARIYSEHLKSEEIFELREP